jgi:hypothetical protein
MVRWITGLLVEWFVVNEMSEEEMGNIEEYRRQYSGLLTGMSGNKGKREKRDKGEAYA